MLPFEDRFTRQRQLAEVGSEGQERIARHRAAIGSGPASEIAALYLERAGVAQIERGPAQVALEPSLNTVSSWGAFSFDVARDFGAGCLLALVELKRALGMREANTSAGRAEQG